MTEKIPPEQTLPESPSYPPFSLRGFVEVLLGQRKTLAGVMSWIGLVTLTSFILIAILAPLIAPYDPTKLFLTPPNQPPSLQHIMGTDDLGRDIFSRALWGAQTSLEIMAIGVILALVIGFPVGL